MSENKLLVGFETWPPALNPEHPDFAFFGLDRTIKPLRENMKELIGYLVKAGPLYRMAGYDWTLDQKRAFVYSKANAYAEAEEDRVYGIESRVVRLVKKTGAK